jgi:hypothetical protein
VKMSSFETRKLRPSISCLPKWKIWRKTKNTSQWLPIALWIRSQWFNARLSYQSDITMSGLTASAWMGAQGRSWGHYSKGHRASWRDLSNWAHWGNRDISQDSCQHDCFTRQSKCQPCQSKIVQLLPKKHRVS